MKKEREREREAVSEKESGGEGRRERNREGDRKREGKRARRRVRDRDLTSEKGRMEGAISWNILTTGFTRPRQPSHESLYFTYYRILRQTVHEHTYT